MGYGRVASDYFSTGQIGRANEYYTTVDDTIDGE